MDDAPSPLARVRNRARRHGSDDAARRRAVLAHLEVLLNTRAGSSLLDPSYGLPDLTDHTHASAPRGVLIAQLVEACVRRHEPRLTHVVARETERSEAKPATLGFALSAALVDGTPLRLRGHVETGAQVVLRAVEA